MPVDLKQAYQWALEHTLQSQLARERIRESEARLQQSWAALNPQVRFTASQFNRTSNLASQGLTGSTFPIGPLVGPFNSFDSRVGIVYNFLNAEARWRVKSSEIGRAISQSEERLAQQQVGTLASLAYVQLTAARESLAAVQADIALAERQVVLAKNQQAAGVAAGIDVTRAENVLVEQTLRRQANAARVRSANLELARLTGRPLDTEFIPAAQSVQATDPTLTRDQAVARARTSRVELSVAQLREKQLQTEISAAEAGTSPTVGVAADYGFAGSTPTSNVSATHNVGVLLSIPFYDGGLSEGRANELRSQLQQATLRREDLSLQVEQDVRQAYLALELAQQQREAAHSGVLLAEKELMMSTDRFAAGVTTSLEVATAQAQLARARDAEVQAGIEYSVALVRLAAAMGDPSAVMLQGGSQ